MMNNLKMPTREQNSNKGTFGKVLNFCGSDNYIGAAYLSVLSSLKIGAGLSALSSTEKVIASVSTILPEAVYLTRREGLKKLNNYTTILIGCGLGLNSASEKLFTQIIRQLQKETMPVVIDADGLNLLAKFTTPQLSLFGKRDLILTPHPMEASRLLGCSLEEVLNDLENSAKKISKKYSCITVLKTHRTIICDKNFKIHRNELGNSALAKAGTGDVLAGMIAGLLAQGMNGFEAAKLGVYLHSRSGEIASKDLTEYSVLATDVIKYLPQAIKEIL